MLCRRSSVKGGGGSVPVHLNVYDLTSINGYAYWLGLGASILVLKILVEDVVIHGYEYAFGAHEYPTTGIFEGEPKSCDGFTFRKSILIGWTDLNEAQVRGIMEKLAEKYRGDAYNLITKNCNHFCNDACIKLTGNPIPKWINRLARIGLLCQCIIPVNLNTTKVSHHRIEDKQCEVEKKKFRSHSNRFSNSSSNSSSSSSCSPPLATTLTDSLSRSRSPLPEPLPLNVESKTN
ncbi:deSI-like protein [Dorcoceras hygrometricum]|uniref:DeSI-like protein n=1 Tax=Dorcoceras hygrometricum TaxID=472368 RepID=A0A2Z7B7S7_9LAMI|nr:deSI-like protein [Dorcoceras hygrometricum]